MFAQVKLNVYRFRSGSVGSVRNRTELNPFLDPLHHLIYGLLSDVLLCPTNKQMGFLLKHMYTIYSHIYLSVHFFLFPIQKLNKGLWCSRILAQIMNTKNKQTSKRVNQSFLVIKTHFKHFCVFNRQWVWCKKSLQYMRKHIKESKHLYIL